MNKFIILISFILVLIIHIAILTNTKTSKKENIQTLDNKMISLKITKSETKTEIQKEEIIVEKQTPKSPIQTKTAKLTDKPSPIKKETKKDNLDTQKIEEKIIENPYIQNNKQEIQKTEQIQNTQEQTLKENEYLKKYKMELREEINKNKTYPSISKRLKEQGNVIVSFRVMNNGVFDNIKINSSSTIKRLDDAALNALYETKKFKAFGNEINKDYLDFELTLEFITLN